MAKIQYSFQRYEKKFILTPGQYHQLLPLLEPWMEADRYGEYTICNLYYDTDTFDLIRTSVSRPPYKEKFRLRSYGVPGEEDRVFGEIKKKFDGVVYKRRVAAPLSEMQSFLAGADLPHESPQIQREIHWFLHCHPIRPKVFIGYDRTACVGREDPALRITFDRNIRWRTRDLDLRAGDHGDPVLPEERVIMEIKIPQAVPLWLVRALDQIRAYPASFSKIGSCYQLHLARKVFAPAVFAPVAAAPAQTPAVFAPAAHNERMKASC